MRTSSSLLIAQWAWHLLPIALVGLNLPLRIGEVGLAVVAMGLAVTLRSRGHSVASQLMGLYTLFLLIFAVLGRWGMARPQMLGEWAAFSRYYRPMLMALFSIALTLPWLTRAIPKIQWKKYGLYYGVGVCLWGLVLIASWRLPHGLERATGTVLFWFLCGLWILGAIPFGHLFNRPPFLRLLAVGVFGLSCWTGFYSVSGYHQLDLGTKAEDSGHYQAALDHYSLATLYLKLPGWRAAAAQAAIRRAQLLLDQGELGPALQALAQANCIQPRLAGPVVMRAEIFIHLGSPQEAWSEVSNLGSLATVSPEQYQRLLFVYLRLQAWEEAAQLIAIAPELLQELHFSNAQADIIETLADALWALDKKPSALQLFQNLLARPSPAVGIYAKVGQLQYEMGMLEDSRAGFKHLEKISSGNATAAHFLGLLAEKDDRCEDALSLYLRSLRVNPEQGFSLDRAIELIKGLPDKSALQSRLEAHLQSLTPTHPVKSIWDNWLLFLGYDLNSRNYKRGEEFTITHYWQVLKPHRTPPIWFLHLDKPYESQHPPSKYQVPEDVCRQYGTIFRVTQRVLIPESLSPGLYRLILGAYRPRYGGYYNLKPVILKDAAFHQLPEKAIYLTKLQIQ
jgi:tetratricopeptide (TPR) repeat protein